jgi:hypothetical protein
VPPHSDRTGSSHSGPIAAAVQRVRNWAGGAPRAILLAGSQAGGSATWVTHENREVSLSDLDLYVVLDSRADCRAAEARQRADANNLERELLAEGLAAPLEAAFFTLADLTALPARPGTLELLRHGRVLEGDPTALAAVRRYSPRDVPAEERLLLLENRAFELLEASVPRAGELAALRARHAVLRTACDLATVIALEHGEYPDGAEARIAWASAHVPAAALMLEPIWARALAWRRAPAAWNSSLEEREEWRAVASAWIAQWSRCAASFAGASGDPWRLVTATAARAPLRRRIRQAASLHARSGRGPSLWNRWRYAFGGTPQHRLNASAVVLLLDAMLADEGDGRERISARAERALAAFGVLPRGLSWNDAASLLLRRWDFWVLGGQRHAGLE